MSSSRKGEKQELPKPLELSKGLKQLYQHQLLCDATLVCEGRRFSCHRVLLAAVSPYFKDVFTSSWKESQGGEVVLQDMSPSLLQSILKYIYTEELSLTLETAPDLFAAASKLQILPLVEICSRFLGNKVSMQNCIGIYTLAQAYNHQALLHATLQLIILNFGRFCEEDDFLRLDLRSLITILSADGLAVASELEVFQAVRRWLQFQPTTCHSLLSELMRHVRLSLLTDKEIVEVQMDSERFGDVQLCWKQLDSEERLHESGGLRQGMYDEQIVSVDAQMWEDQELENEDFLMGSYDPLAEKWEKLPGLKSLTHPACVALGDKLYVSGGICRNSYSDALYEFNSFKGQWTQLPSMSVPRATHGFLSCNQRLYAMGGWCGFHEFLNSAECFDIAEQIWTPISMMPFVLSRSASTVLKKKLYLLGGAIGLTSYWQFHRGLLIYEVSSDTWTQVSLNNGFFSAGAVAIDNGIYVIGGYAEKRAREWAEGGLVPENRHCTRKCFFITENGKVNEEIVIPKLPKGIANAAVVHWKKRIYVLGGENLTQCYKTIYYWEPGQPKWNKCPEDIPVSYEGVSGFGCTTLKIPKKEILSLFQKTSVALTAVVGK
ncbi:kelch-like protein 12 [Emydura macquarii macquarii]|uniref:kelch-like protein 12 n=1 Tax=Emydura macquarii macquarii TaxID=1129001 RepID=UPI00352AEF83